jgi:hypothetical protein
MREQEYMSLRGKERRMFKKAVAAAVAASVARVSARTVPSRMGVRVHLGADSSTGRFE